MRHLARFLMDREMEAEDSPVLAISPEREDKQQRLLEKLKKSIRSMILMEQSSKTLKMSHQEEKTMKETLFPKIPSLQVWTQMQR